MTENTVDFGRGSVFYRFYENDNPNASCIVFLHGLTADHTLFDKQIPAFSENFSVLVWDAPCHAKSRPHKEFSYSDCAEDLKCLLDREGISSAYFAGQSMGGYVIQTFYKMYPDVVKAFVGIDTCPFGEAYYSRSDKWWLRQIEWMSRLYPMKLLVRSVAGQCTYTDYGYKNMLDILSVYDNKNELCHLMGMGYAGFLSENCDMEIKCPTLILVGEHDRTGKVKSYCSAWHKATGFPLLEIKNAAHNSNADNPDDVNRAILDFISQN